jgi:hypothetical protein
VSAGRRRAQESEEGDSAGAASHHFVKQALQPLVAMLLEQLVKQEEGQVRGGRGLHGIWGSPSGPTAAGLPERRPPPWRSGGRSRRLGCGVEGLWRRV